LILPAHWRKKMVFGCCVLRKWSCLAGEHSFAHYYLGGAKVGAVNSTSVCMDEKWVFDTYKHIKLTWKFAFMALYS
jgi:hypothetical protein